MKYQIFRKFRTVLLEKQVRIRISVGETTAFNFSAIDRDAVTKIREKTLVTYNIMTILLSFLLRIFNIRISV